jgi:hypothetical protein
VAEDKTLGNVSFQALADNTFTLMNLPEEQPGQSDGAVLVLNIEVGEVSSTRQW